MRTLLLTAALVLHPVAAAIGAQVTVVDEGSFTVTRDGRTGREDFRIVRTPMGGAMTLVASGTAVVGFGHVCHVLPQVGRRAFMNASSSSGVIPGAISPPARTS